MGSEIPLSSAPLKCEKPVLITSSKLSFSGQNQGGGVNGSVMLVAPWAKDKAPGHKGCGTLVLDLGEGS